MQILTDIALYVALAAAAAALILALLLWAGLRRLRRSQAVVMGHHEERDVVTAVHDLDAQVRNLREAVEILTDELDHHKAQLDRALTNRALIRYDAFRDAGGEQSASFALLDSYRSGVVFSAIAARDFARLYVKHLDNGIADRDLSPEEEEAMKAAVPRPLTAGEAGPRAARAPRPAGAERPPSGGPSPGPDDRAAEAAPEPEPGDQPAPQAPPAAPGPDSTAETRPGGDAPGRPAFLDDETFTWVEPDVGDEPPERQPPEG